LFAQKEKLEAKQRERRNNDRSARVLSLSIALQSARDDVEQKKVSRREKL
jgi:hypothetical protein